MGAASRADFGGMVRLLIVLALAAAAGGVAVVLQRRRPRPDLGPPQWSIPGALDRGDFDRPSAPWLVVEFSSATCDTCAAVWDRVRLLESGEVAVQEVEVRRDRGLHQRYEIDAVPLVVVADRTGAVRAHHLGPTTAADLWGTLADLRRVDDAPPAEGQADTGTEPERRP